MKFPKNWTIPRKRSKHPLGISKVEVLSDRIVIAAVLRAGVPMLHGLAQMYDHADQAFISAYRKHHKDGSFEVQVDYITCPDLTDVILIIADPMLATGSSLEKSIESLLEFGRPKEVHAAIGIAASAGVNHIKRLFPNTHLWLGAQDEELTAKSYIVPGLGDAGDLAFGEKLVE